MSKFYFDVIHGFYIFEVLMLVIQCNLHVVSLKIVFDLISKHQEES